MYPYKNRQGRCYEIAGKIILDHYREGMVLVHGELLNAGLHAGTPYRHAWIECEGKVYDSNLDEEMPKEEYYEHYKATAHAVYTRQEAAKAISSNSSWGPWSGKPAASEEQAGRLGEQPAR